MVAGCSSSSSVQPALTSGFSSGAASFTARTVTGPRPTPSSPRIIETAWYWWVEDTWTCVGVPIAPDATTAARAACNGIIRYCSATCTSRDAPTWSHSRRRPSTSGAGGVSASTGSPSDTASSIIPGVVGHGTAVTTKSGRVACTQASSESKVGTANGRGDRTTAPTQSTVSSPRLTRANSSARQPAPMRANVVTGRP